MRILITDSDNRSALAATRSLGKRGHTVFTAGDRHPSLASVSKYSAGFDLYTSPYESPTRHVADVARIVRERTIDVVLPMTEITTLLLTEHQGSFPSHVRLPFPPTEIVSAASNKAHVVALAAQIGVPVPRTEILERAADLPDATPRLSYPVVVKPARSRVWTGREWLATTVSYAHSLDELESKLAAMPAALFPILLQERIEGPGVGVFMCCDEQGVVASFSHRRIREKPPSGGVSVLSESTAVDPNAQQHAAKLLERLGWRGVAMVEFKQDARDGQLRLMEINGRFWGSLQLAIDAGVDFPNLLIDLLEGKRADTPPQYRLGVRTRWFWGDTDAMLSLLLRSPAALNLPPSHPGRWRSLRDYLKFWSKNTRYELERAEDLAPWRLETKRWLLNRR